jgi:hypothetical protein
MEKKNLSNQNNLFSWRGEGMCQNEFLIFLIFRNARIFLKFPFFLRSDKKQNLVHFARTVLL